jgi:hypothetical protein
MRFAELASSVVGGSPAEYETEKWAKVIKLAGIKPE